METPSPFTCEKSLQVPGHPQFDALWDRLQDSELPAELHDTYPADLIYNIEKYRLALAALHELDGEFDERRFDVRRTPQAENAAKYTVSQGEAAEFVDRLITVAQAIMIVDDDDYKTADLAWHLAEGVGFSLCRDDFREIELAAVKYAQGPELIRDLDIALGNPDHGSRDNARAFFDQHDLTDDQMMQLVSHLTLDRSGISFESMTVNCLLQDVSILNRERRRWKKEAMDHVEECVLYREGPVGAAQEIEAVFSEDCARIRPEDQVALADSIIETIESNGEELVRPNHLRAILLRLMEEKYVCVQGGEPTYDDKRVYPSEGMKWVKAKSRYHAANRSAFTS